MNHILRLSLFTLLLMLSTGCLLGGNSYQPTNRYDLGVPTVKKSNLNLKIATFSDSVPFKNRMVLRRNKQQLFPDEFNLWILPPGRMISNYIRQSYPPQSGNPQYKISGEIIRCEMNEEDLTATLSIRYRIEKSDGTSIKDDTFISSKTLAAITAPSFAKSIADSTKAFIKKFEEQIH